MPNQGFGFHHSTYDAGTYVTHVFMQNRMFHAGDPVGWTNLTESFGSSILSVLDGTNKRERGKE